MLCPEVWDFRPPFSLTAHKLVKNEKDIWRTAGNQYFNHSVSITVPDSMQIHSSIHSVLSKDSDYYHVQKVSACEFVKSEFIDFFVKKGKLTLLSVGTNLDEDDCVAITPKGHLLFSLRRRTFQELGLDGKPSAFSSGVPEKYIVNIDIAADTFKPGKRNYDRVYERLTKKKRLSFDVVLAWDPHKPDICPSSIAAYFTYQGCPVKTCNLSIKQRQEYNVNVPVFDEETDLESLTEWLGAFNLGCHIPDKANGFVSTFEAPERHLKFGQVVTLQAVGLITTARIDKLIRRIRDFVPTLGETAWLGLNVNGFEDAVVNRGNQEHFYYCSGDYNYTMIFKDNCDTLLSVHTSSYKRPKTKTRSKRSKH